jgi:CO/xanthine dehydrogenase Mo-binding subunit
MVPRHGRVRYVGEPIAVVLARNRDTAEDALEQIAVEYRPLPPIVDPEAPLLGRNSESVRRSASLGAPAAFARIVPRFGGRWGLNQR